MRNTAIINEIPMKHKAVAFTFDDGPDPLYTPQILDILRQAGAEATFYMIGSQIEANPQLAKLVHEQGHEIGNHTFSHPHLTELNEQDCRNELVRTDNGIKEITGKSPLTFRPPYLDINDLVLSQAERLGYKVIGGVNGEARDWDQPGTQHIIDKTLEQVRPGSILLFHDGYGDRSQTVEAVRSLVTGPALEGYELVTVSRLLHMADS